MKNPLSLIQLSYRCIPLSWDEDNAHYKSPDRRIEGRIIGNGQIEIASETDFVRVDIPKDAVRAHVPSQIGAAIFNDSAYAAIRACPKYTKKSDKPEYGTAVFFGKMNRDAKNGLLTEAERKHVLKYTEKHGIGVYTSMREALFSRRIGLNTFRAAIQNFILKDKDPSEWYKYAEENNAIPSTNHSESYQKPADLTELHKTIAALYSNEEERNKVLAEVMQQVHETYGPRFTLQQALEYLDERYTESHAASLATVPDDIKSSKEIFEAAVDNADVYAPRQRRSVIAKLISIRRTCRDRESLWEALDRFEQKNPPRLDDVIRYLASEYPAGERPRVERELKTLTVATCGTKLWVDQIRDVFAYYQSAFQNNSAVWNDIYKFAALYPPNEQSSVVDYMRGKVLQKSEKVNATCPEYPGPPGVLFRLRQRPRVLLFPIEDLKKSYTEHNPLPLTQMIRQMAGDDGYAADAEVYVRSKLKASFSTEQVRKAYAQYYVLRPPHFRQILERTVLMYPADRQLVVRKELESQMESTWGSLVPNGVQLEAICKEYRGKNPPPDMGFLHALVDPVYPEKWRVEICNAIIRQAYSTYGNPNEAQLMETFMAFRKKMPPYVYYMVDELAEAYPERQRSRIEAAMHHQIAIHFKSAAPKPEQVAELFGQQVNNRPPNWGAADFSTIQERTLFNVEKAVPLDSLISRLVPQLPQDEVATTVLLLKQKASELFGRDPVTPEHLVALYVQFAEHQTATHYQPAVDKIIGKPAKTDSPAKLAEVNAEERELAKAKAQSKAEVLFEIYMDDIKATEIKIADIKKNVDGGPMASFELQKSLSALKIFADKGMEHRENLNKLSDMLPAAKMEDLRYYLNINSMNINAAELYQNRIKRLLAERGQSASI